MNELGQAILGFRTYLMKKRMKMREKVRSDVSLIVDGHLPKKNREGKRKDVEVLVDKGETSMAENEREGSSKEKVGPSPRDTSC